MTRAAVRGGGPSNILASSLKNLWPSQERPARSRPVLEIPISSPPSPSGGVRGRLPLRGRPRRGHHHDAVALRRDAPPHPGAGRETHGKILAGVDVFYNLPNFPYGKGGFDVSGGGG